MKRIIFALVLVVAGLGFADAQGRAIGGRIGYGIDFSYQHSLGTSNMVNIEVGLPAFYGVAAAATYDWIFPIQSWKEKGSWNWYAGVGAGLGVNFNGCFNVGVAGRIGVEYNFWFPLQLSLDWRPVVGPGFGKGGAYFHSGGLYDGIALGVRYILK